MRDLDSVHNHLDVIIWHSTLLTNSVELLLPMNFMSKGKKWKKN